MSLYQNIASGEAAVAVIGLGYVGLPIAVAFSKTVKVIGYDRDEHKIALYKQGIDPTCEVGDEALRASTIEFTADETALRRAKFHIVAVPTPVKEDHTPDLEPLEQACAAVGRQLTKGSFVVLESTVYPGVTQDICAPILERESNLVCGVDFQIGYSPERINPGDREHRFETITKIVSAANDEALEEIANVYALAVKAGIYRAPSIAVAEAAKVIENSQRDINIAFMNELSIIFQKMNIDTKAVLEAARTKWNFMPFAPGLVGGHCIGVDPYYLTYKAEQLGYHSQVILAGRRINDGMGKYVAEQTIKAMIASGIDVKTARVAVLGVTFKENCPDTRNSKVLDIIRELREYGVEPLVADPLADAEQVKAVHGVTLSPMESICNVDVLIVAVAHDAFSTLTPAQLGAFFGDRQRVLADVKGVWNRQECEALGYRYWRL